MNALLAPFTHPDALLVTGVFAVLLSLALAWLASFIIYGKIAFLKKIFPAPFQLIRAHIDLLMMSFLLGLSHYLIERQGLNIPAWVILLFCVGAIYNPLGFVFLAIKPKLGNPETLAEKLKIYIGFLPATIGPGYVMVCYLLAVL